MSSNITLEEYKKIIEKDKKVVLFFKTITYNSKYKYNLLFDFIHQEYKDIKIIEVNIENNCILADKFNITILPTCIFIYDKTKIHQEEGLWNGGQNIIGCFANLIIHSQLKHSNTIHNKNKQDIHKEYHTKVKQLHHQLMNSYLNYLENH